MVADSARKGSPQDRTPWACVGDKVSAILLKGVSGYQTLLKSLGDVRTNMAEMEARLLRSMAEMHRWTLTAIFAGMGAVAVIAKLWH